MSDRSPIWHMALCGTLSALLWSRFAYTDRTDRASSRPYCVRVGDTCVACV